MSAAMTDFDFLVVGSGIAGASAAAMLSARARVAVIERESAHGYHTTGRSAALYSPLYGNAVFRALTVASRDFLLAPPEGFAEHPILSPRGVLYIATDEQRASLEAVEVGAASLGIRTVAVAGDEARALCPALRPGHVAAALYEPDAMDIDVETLHQGYLRLARANGAAIRLESELAGLERSAGGWRVRLVGGETIEARVVINAAGAWADVVAGLAGARPVGLAPLRRTAFIVAPPDGADVTGWPSVIDADENFYFKPDAGRLLVSPADETPSAPCDAWAEDLTIAECVERLQEAADIPVRRILRSWAGLRTFAPDRSPVIGFDPQVEGFFWLAGQGGYGVQSSAGAGRTAASLALGEDVPADVAALDLTAAQISPERFAIDPVACL
jgi:D-arginine dehydrogenase